MQDESDLKPNLSLFALIKLPQIKTLILLSLLDVDFMVTFQFRLWNAAAFDSEFTKGAFMEPVWPHFR